MPVRLPGLLFAAAVTAVTFGVPAFAQDTSTPPKWWGWGHMWGWGDGGWFFPLPMFIFWGLIIALIVLLIRWTTGRGERVSASSSALETLRERFARGEIDKAEFEDRKKTLRG